MKKILNPIDDSDRKEIQELIEISALNIENDYWLKSCIWKGDCTFLYLTAPVMLSEKGKEVKNLWCT